MAPAVPIGAAGEKFLKFDTFSCIFKAFFRQFLICDFCATHLRLYCICAAGEKFENCPPFL